MNIDNRLTIYGFDEQDETILNNRISKFGLTSVPAKAIAVYEIGSPNAADATATLYNNGLLEFEGSGDIVEFWYYDEMPWYDYRSNITSVSFKTGNTIKPTSTAYLFYGLSNITSLDLSNLDTSNVTNMTWMFNGCESLIKIKGSENLVSSKVTTMERIFNYCISLSSLETSNWNTSNVSIMTGIFDGCKSLTSLDLSSFNTSKVKSMDYMFYGCESLTEIIGLDNFDTSEVTSMNSMFYECNNLSSSITIMCADTIYFRNMFTNCSIEPGTEFIVKYKDTTEDIVIDMIATKSENSNVFLRSGTVSKAYNIGYPVASDVIATLYEDGVLEFNGSGDIEKYYSIYNEETGEGTEKFAPWYDDIYFYSIRHVVFAKNNTIQPTSTSYLFYELPNVTNIDLSNLDTSNVTNMESMFDTCRSLTSLDLSNFNTSNVINMSYMFRDCVSLASLDLSNWNTSNVTNMGNMFGDCESLTSLDLSHLNTSSVRTMVSMFAGCNKLTSLDLSNWNTSNVITMADMFDYCISLTSLNLSNLDTSSVTDMNYMFYDCTNLSGSITIMNPNITEYSNMFINCSTEPGSEFVVKYVDKTTKAIAEAMVSTKSENSNVVLYIPPAYLIKGQDFNTAIKSFNNITSIRFANEPPIDPTPGDLLVVSEDTSPTKAYMAQLITGEIIVYPEEAGSSLVANKSCYRMFHGTSVTSINFNNFDTSKVTNMSYMFRNCELLTSLDLSNFNTSNVTNMSYMFNGCSKLVSICVKDLWDISNVFASGNMFYGCTSIIGKSGTSYNSSKVGKEMANIETGYLTDEKLLLVKTAFENTYKITIINHEEYINIKTQPGVTSYNAQIHVELYDTLEIGKSYKISIETFNGASFYSSMSGNSAGAGDGTWNTNGNISELIFTATSATSELVLFSTGFYMMLPNTPVVDVVNIRFYEIF